MKVVLLHDIPKIGKRYETKTVADGYAANLLIPMGLVRVADSKMSAWAEGMRAKDAAERKIQEDLLEKNLKSVGEIVLKMTEKANEKGHLFAGIRKEQIIAALKKNGHLEIPAHYLDMEKPIKEVGEHDIRVSVGNTSATFKIVVRAGGAEEVEIEKA